MNLTEHTDYGLRALILLTAVAPSRLSSAELARRYGVSHAHMQKVVQSLQAAGFVQTFRGRGGGVQLARRPDDIRVGDVVRALEPHMDFVQCFRPGQSACPLCEQCALASVLVKAKAAMLAELDRVTVADITTRTPTTRALIFEERY